LSHKLTLEVEDTENVGVKQEPKEIELKAEAFFISVKTDLRNEEDLIDFGNVRVGEPKEKVIALKNEGKYPV
jgi:hydrocephalus-inducing protein